MLMLLGSIFVLSNQPMIIISSLMMIVLLMSIYLMWGLSSFWFSYMVMLILLSGVLVVFTYMMSVLPNESFEVSSLIIVIFSILGVFEYKMYVGYIQDVSLGSMKIWGGASMVKSIFFVIYLLVVMVMIVWISNLEKGAIRIA